MLKNDTNTSNNQTRDTNNEISRSSSLQSDVEGNNEWRREVSSYSRKRQSILHKNIENILNNTSDISNVSKNWWKNLTPDKSILFAKPANISSENEQVSEPDTTGNQTNPEIPQTKKLFTKTSATRRFSKAFNDTTKNQSKIDETIPENTLSDVNTTNDSQTTSTYPKNKKLFEKNTAKRKFSLVFDDSSNKENSATSALIDEDTGPRRSKRSLTPVDYGNNGALKPIVLDSAEKLKNLVFDKKQQLEISQIFNANEIKTPRKSPENTPKSRSKIPNRNSSSTRKLIKNLTPKNLFDKTKTLVDETTNLDYYKNCYVKLERMPPPVISPRKFYSSTVETSKTSNIPENSRVVDQVDFLEKLQLSPKTLFKKNLKTRNYSDTFASFNDTNQSGSSSRSVDVSSDSRRYERKKSKHNSSRIDDDNIETPPRKSRKINFESFEKNRSRSRLNHSKNRASRILEYSETNIEKAKNPGNKSVNLDNSKLLEKFNIQEKSNILEKSKILENPGYAPKSVTLNQSDVVINKSPKKSKILENSHIQEKPQILESPSSRTTLDVFSRANIELTPTSTKSKNSSKSRVLDQVELENMEKSSIIESELKTESGKKETEITPKSTRKSRILEHSNILQNSSILEKPEILKSPTLRSSSNKSGTEKIESISEHPKSSRKSKILEPLKDQSSKLMQEQTKSSRLSSKPENSKILETSNILESPAHKSILEVSGIERIETTPSPPKTRKSNILEPSVLEQLKEPLNQINLNSTNLENSSILEKSKTTPNVQKSTNLNNTKNMDTSELLEITENLESAKTPENSKNIETRTSTKTRKSKFLSSTKLENSNKSSTESLNVSIIEKDNTTFENYTLEKKLETPTKRILEKSIKPNTRSKINPETVEITPKKNRTKSPENTKLLEISRLLENSIKSPTLRYTSKSTTEHKINNTPKDVLEKTKLLEHSVKSPTSRSMKMLEKVGCFAEENRLGNSVKSPPLNTTVSRTSRNEKTEPTPAKNSTVNIEKMESPENSKLDVIKMPTSSRTSRNSSVSRKEKTESSPVNIEKMETPEKSKIDVIKTPTSSRTSKNCRVSRIEKKESTPVKNLPVNIEKMESPEKSKIGVIKTPTSSRTSRNSSVSRIKKTESTPVKNSSVNIEKLESPEKFKLDVIKTPTSSRSTRNSSVSRIEKTESTSVKNLTFNIEKMNSPENSKMEDVIKTPTSSRTTRNSSVSRIEKTESTPVKNLATNIEKMKSPEKSKKENSIESPSSSSSRTSRTSKMEAIPVKNSTINNEASKQSEKSQIEDSSKSPSLSSRNSRTSRTLKIESTPVKNLTLIIEASKSPEKPELDISITSPSLRSKSSRISRIVDKIESTPGKKQHLRKTKKSPEKLETLPETSENLDSRKPDILENLSNTKTIIKNTTFTKERSSPKKMPEKSKNETFEIVGSKNLDLPQIETFETVQSENITRTQEKINTTFETRKRAPSTRSSKNLDSSEIDKNKTNLTGNEIKTPETTKITQKARDSRRSKNLEPSESPTTGSEIRTPEKSEVTITRNISTRSKNLDPSDMSTKSTRSKNLDPENVEEISRPLTGNIVKTPEKSKNITSSNNLDSKTGNDPTPQNVSKRSKKAHNPDEGPSAGNDVRTPEKSNISTASKLEPLEIDIKSTENQIQIPEKQNISTPQKITRSKLLEPLDIDLKSTGNKSKTPDKQEKSIKPKITRSKLLEQENSEKVSTRSKTLDLAEIDLKSTGNKIKTPEKPNHSTPQKINSQLIEPEKRSKTLDLKSTGNQIKTPEKPETSPQKTTRSSTLEPEKISTRSKTLDPAELDLKSTGNKIKPPEKPKTSTPQKITRSTLELQKISTRSKTLDPAEIDLKSTGNKTKSPEKPITSTPQKITRSTLEHEKISTRSKTLGTAEIDLKSTGNKIKTPDKSTNSKNKLKTPEKESSSKILEPPKTPEISDQSRKSLKRKLFDNESMTTIERRKSILKSPFRPQTTEKKSVMFSDTFTIHQQDQTGAGNDSFILSTLDSIQDKTDNGKINLFGAKRRRSLFSDGDWSEENIMSSTKLCPVRTSPVNNETINSNPRNNESINSNPRNNEPINSNPRNNEIITGDPKNNEIMDGDPRINEIIEGDPKINEITEGDPEINELMDEVPESNDHMDESPENNDSFNDDPKKSETSIMEIIELNDDEPGTGNLLKQILMDNIPETTIKETETTDVSLKPRNKKTATKKYEEAVRKQMNNAKRIKQKTTRTNKKPKFYQGKRWCTIYLFKHLENKMKNIYPERVLPKKIDELMEFMAESVEIVKRAKKKYFREVTILKKELARNNVIKTHYDFFCFVADYLPFEYRRKVVPCAQANSDKPTVEFDEKLLHEKICY